LEHQLLPFYRLCLFKQNAAHLQKLNQEQHFPPGATLFNASGPETESCVFFPFCKNTPQSPHSKHEPCNMSPLFINLSPLDPQ
jgi:hypothetical protein